MSSNDIADVTPTRVYAGISNINIQELLKAQIYDEKITPLEKNSSNQVKFERSHPQKPYTTQTFGVSDQYLILDSFLKSTESIPEKGELKWNISQQGSTTLSPPSIGVIDYLSTITEIEIGQFTMPILPEYLYPLSDQQTVNKLSNYGIALNQNNSTNTFPDVPAIPSANLTPIVNQLLTPITIPPWTNDPLSQILFGNILTIQIKESGLQSISDVNGNRHHFEFTLTNPAFGIDTAPNTVIVTPTDISSGGYVFTEPLIDLKTMTLIFRNPDVPIIFDPDFFICTASIDFSETIPTLKFYYPSHDLLTGEVIHVTKFASGFSVLDNYINRSDITQNGNIGISGNLLVGAAPNPDGSSQNLITGRAILSVVNGYYVRSPYFYLDPFVQFANKGYITKFVVTSYTPAIPGSPGTPASATIVATINTIIDSVPASTTVTINWTDTATPQSQNYTGTFIISTYTGTYNIYIYSVDPILPHIVNGGGFYIIQIIPQGIILNYIVSNYTPTNATITATIQYLFGNTQITFNWNSLQTIYRGTFVIGTFSGIYQITIISVTSTTVVVDPINTFCTLTFMSTTCGIYVAKRRIRIPVRIRTIVNRVTNFITPS